VGSAKEGGTYQGFEVGLDRSTDGRLISIDTGVRLPTGMGGREREEDNYG
jgi:hypothetical protein